MMDLQTTFRLVAKDETGAAMQSVKRNLADLKSSAAAVGPALAAIGAGAIGAFFVSSVKAAVTELEGLHNAAMRTGSSVEDLSGILERVKPTGAGLEDVTRLTDRITKAMREAKKEGSEAAQIFAKLKVSPLDAAGNLRAPSQVLVDVAKAFNQYADGGNKAAIAQKLLGTSAGASLPALRALGQEGALAAKYTTEQAEQAARFAEEMRNLKEAVDDLKVSIGAGLLPELAKLARGLSDGIGASGGFWNFLTSGLSATDFGDAEQKMYEVEGRLDKLRRARDAVAGSLANRTPIIRSLPFVGTAGDLAALDMQIGGLETQQGQLAAAARAQRGRERPAVDLPQAPGIEPRPRPPGAGRIPDFQRLRAQYLEQQALVTAQRDAVDGLTDAERTLVRLEADVASGKVTLTAREQESLQAILQRTAAIERAGEEEERGQKLRERAAAFREQERAHAQASADALNKEADAQRLRTEEIGKEAAALLALRDARIADRIEQERARLRTLQSEGGDPAQIAISTASVSSLETIRTQNVDEAVATLRAELAERERSIQSYALSTDALIALKNARVDEQIATLQSIAIREQEKGGNDALVASLQEYVALLQSSKGLNAIEVQTQRNADVARDLGLAFKSAAEEAIVNFEGVRSVLRGLEQDLLRIATRKLVTEPLANWGTDLLRSTMPSLFGAPAGGSLSSVAWGAAPFEDGGIMTAQGPVPLRRYAGGGVAREPQAAIFGEGSMAEAYVPLPDGRTIPVTMRGGGGAGETHFHFHGVKDMESFRRSEGQMRARVAGWADGAGRYR